MPIDHVDAWSQFGLAGLVIAALFALIYFMSREHRAERLEWIEAYRDGVRMADERQCETNTVIRELVSVVREQNARLRD